MFFIFKFKKISLGDFLRVDFILFYQIINKIYNYIIIKKKLNLLTLLKIQKIINRLELSVTFI